MRRRAEVNETETKFAAERARVSREALAMVDRYCDECDFINTVVQSITGEDSKEFENLAAQALIYHSVFYGTRPELREANVGCIHRYIPSENAVRVFDWKIKVTKEVRNNVNVVLEREELILLFNVVNHHTILSDAIRTYRSHCILLSEDTRQRLKVLLARIAGTFPEHYMKEARRAGITNAATQK